MTAIDKRSQAEPFAAEMKDPDSCRGHMKVNLARFLCKYILVKSRAGEKSMLLEDKAVSYVGSKRFKVSTLFSSISTEIKQKGIIKGNIGAEAYNICTYNMCSVCT